MNKSMLEIYLISFGSAGSAFDSLSAPQTGEEDQFDVIIASDMVCCEGDAEGVAQCVAKFLRPQEGVAVFVIPTDYHRSVGLTC
jgi:2-polyprenyl-3-methyl-5-hydroxy-6-metoxy-1,4-benzoquinol methylase